MGNVAISKFRKDLFQYVESAANGDPVEFTHKGIRFQLVRPDLPVTDKLGRITKLAGDPLTGTASELVSAHRKMSKEIVSDWEAGWNQ